MDSTPTDILIWTSDGPQRLWAVLAVCTSTRYLWLRLVPSPPRGIHLALLLWDMIGGDGLWSGKTSLATLPALPSQIDVNAWIVDGDPPATLPGCIVLDHGAEEENWYFISFCAILGIEVLWARTMQPTDKAYVESHIKKFAEHCQQLPGHKGNTVENRPHRDSPTLLRLEGAQAAMKLWAKWIATQPHTGLAHELAPQRYLTSLEAVAISLSRGIPVRVLADPTLPLRLLKYVSITPQDDGVPWQRRRYTGPDFEDVLEASSVRGPRVPMTFYYDPDAPLRLYWPEPGTFHVRTLSAPGADSGVIGAFEEVRQAMLQSLAGQKWPTHNEMVSRRADLLELLTAAFQGDGLGPENVVPMSRARNRNRRQSLEDATANQPLGNGGWTLDEFDDALAEYRSFDAGDDHDAWDGAGS